MSTRSLNGCLVVTLDSLMLVRTRREMTEQERSERRREMARWIRRRESLGLTQEALVFRPDLGQTYVSRIELGVRNPARRMIVRLAQALGTRASRLLRAAEARCERSRCERRG